MSSGSSTEDYRLQALPESTDERFRTIYAPVFARAETLAAEMHERAERLLAAGISSRDVPMEAVKLVATWAELATVLQNLGIGEDLPVLHISR